MAKLHHHLTLRSLFIVSSVLPSTYSKRKTTNVRIYLQGHFNTSQPVEYGDVFAFQEILTVGSIPIPTFLGYAEGTIAFADNEGTLYDLHVLLTYIFHSVQYNRSSVTAVGRNDLTQAVREFPIVGGTCALKLARGIVIETTFSEDPQI